MSRRTPDADSLQVRLRGERGPRFWRALEELADSEAFRRELRQSHPRLAEAAALDRRGFLKFLGASLALAGLAGCSRPPEDEIVPWVRQPEGVRDDLPQFYASALACAGTAVGVLVESHMGRPTKIEGNPSHPDSLGAADAITQAAVLQVWDPDRSQAPLHDGVETTWDAYEAAAVAAASRFRADGSGLRVLSGRILSPTLAAQREAFLARFPGARWVQYEAVDDVAARAAARLVFGRPLQPRYHLDRAAVVLAVDADVLASGPGHLAHARAFARGRRPGAGMNRLYAVEPTPSLTGAIADHRWALDPGAVEAFVEALAARLGIAGAEDHIVDAALARRLDALAADLKTHAGRGLVLAGPGQPSRVHVLVHLLNAALGHAGRTVEYAEPAAPAPADEGPALRDLAQELQDGRVDTLLLLDANPLYDAPADLDFARRMRNVPHRIHLGLYRDESARACTWHLPMAHALEQWSDACGSDGSAAIVQPLMQPLYDGRSAHEVLAPWLGQPRRSGRETVRAYWRARLSGDFAQAWDGALREGVIAGSARPARAARADPSALARVPAPQPVDADALTLLFRPDPALWDGRHANNGWLQELPRPMTQLAWGNAALVAPELAEAQGLGNGDEVELSLHGRSLRIPVWIQPGQAPRSVTVHLGYGRRHAGRVGDGVGTDVYPLRTSRDPWVAPGLRLRPTGHTRTLTSTQHHFSMDEREPVRSASLANFLHDPDFARKHASGPPPSLYPPRGRGEYGWGMSIDLNSCIGCKACTIACQAENNIPVVGAEQVRMGREMHWIRVDRYYQGAPQAPRMHHQPVPCMHCEHAPCEVVCPVGATLHDSEGLNLQVYNRCVGTRFCSNNCPYKVRRFNFLQYADLHTESLKGQRNPDVTVRNRGVMEKCTYCIQRIETAHIQADREGRRIADGEVVTACQATCPTQAISFGDMHDPDTEVSRAKASPRDYALLEELGTRPHTSYGAHVRNPHPDLEDET